MARFKVVMTFSDGEVLDSVEMDGENGIFDTEEDAEDYSLECMNNLKVGGQVLYLSNPGDYPFEAVEDDPECEIVEI